MNYKKYDGVTPDGNLLNITSNNQEETMPNLTHAIITEIERIEKIAKRSCKLTLMTTLVLHTLEDYNYLKSYLGVQDENYNNKSL